MVAEYKRFDSFLRHANLRQSMTRLSVAVLVRHFAFALLLLVLTFLVVKARAFSIIFDIVRAFRAHGSIICGGASFYDLSNHRLIEQLDDL